MISCIDEKRTQSIDRADVSLGSPKKVKDDRSKEDKSKEDRSKKQEGQRDLFYGSHYCRLSV